MNRRIGSSPFIIKGVRHIRYGYWSITLEHKYVRTTNVTLILCFSINPKIGDTVEINISTT